MWFIWDHAASTHAIGDTVRPPGFYQKTYGGISKYIDCMSEGCSYCLSLSCVLLLRFSSWINLGSCSFSIKWDVETSVTDLGQFKLTWLNMFILRMYLMMWLLWCRLLQKVWPYGLFQTSRHYIAWKGIQVYRIFRTWRTVHRSKAGFIAYWYY